MSRIAETFAGLRREGRTGLVTYTTAGDPDLARSADILKALDRAGADVLEVGVPFSDPLADGPVIQRATERALAAGTTLTGVLDLVRSIRQEVKAPIVIFSYANPLLKMGLPAFADRAAAAGVDGVLALDLPIEEADEFRSVLAARGVDTIFLLSPTTTEARIKKAAELGRGFLYGISRLGVTGARDRVATGAEAMVQANPAGHQHADRVGIRDLAAGARGGSRSVRRCGRRRKRAGVAHCRGERVAAAARTSRKLRARSQERLRSLTDITPMTLDDLRRDIDRVDEVLVRLLNERARCVCEIGRLKKELNIEVYQPDREKEVLRHVRDVACEGPLGPDAIGRLFERIIDEARTLERRVVHNEMNEEVPPSPKTAARE